MTFGNTQRIHYVWLVIAGFGLCSLAGCQPTSSERSVNQDSETSSGRQGSLLPSESSSSVPTDVPEQPQQVATTTLSVMLQGRFTFGGPPPAPRMIETNLAFCGKTKMEDESLLVDPYNRGVANVCIWLDTDGVQSPGTATQDPVTVLNENCQFVPHIVSLRVDQTLRIQNADPIGHILKIDGFQNEPVVANLPVKNSIEAVFPSAERVPSIMTSSVYPWMRGYLIVKDHGYVTTSQRDGSFQLRGLPAGKLRFQVWHEKVGYVREVKINNTAVEWKRGRFEVELQDDTDLGEIVIPADLFAT